VWNSRPVSQLSKNRRFHHLSSPRRIPALHEIASRLSFPLLGFSEQNLEDQQCGAHHAIPQVARRAAQNQRQTHAGVLIE